jgi:hypothetical protein
MERGIDSVLTDMEISSGIDSALQSKCYLVSEILYYSHSILAGGLVEMS